MATLKESAETYERKQTKNIADLDEVPLDLEVYKGEGTDSDGKTFTYNYVELNEEHYRVPNSVLEEMKAILEAKPDTKLVKVKKTGEGLGTKYKVIQL